LACDFHDEASGGTFERDLASRCAADVFGGNGNPVLPQDGSRGRDVVITNLKGSAPAKHAGTAGNFGDQASPGTPYVGKLADEIGYCGVGEFSWLTILAVRVGKDHVGYCAHAQVGMPQDNPYARAQHGGEHGFFIAYRRLAHSHIDYFASER